MILTLVRVHRFVSLQMCCAIFRVISRIKISAGSIIGDSCGQLTLNQSKSWVPTFSDSLQGPNYTHW